jgi:hypothetical protein
VSSEPGRCLDTSPVSATCCVPSARRLLVRSHAPPFATTPATGSRIPPMCVLHFATEHILALQPLLAGRQRLSMPTGKRLMCQQSSEFPAVRKPRRTSRRSRQTRRRRLSTCRVCKPLPGMSRGTSGYKGSCRRCGSGSQLPRPKPRHCRRRCCAPPAGRHASALSLGDVKRVVSCALLQELVVLSSRQLVSPVGSEGGL